MTEAPWLERMDEEQHGGYAYFVAWEEWIVDMAEKAGQGFDLVLDEMDILERIGLFSIMAGLFEAPIPSVASLPRRDTQ